MPVKLADVAQRAGVSEATASRVLNRHGYASAGAREAVERAAQDLDYVPNRAARDLSRATTATIALLVHHAQYPVGGEGTFGSRVIEGVTRSVQKAGHDLLYVVVGDGEVARLGALPSVRSGRSDGVLLLGPTFPPASVRSLIDANRPVVLIDNRSARPPVDAVLADNRPAVERLTAHLLVDHGYRRVVCLAGPARWPSTAERVAGYRAAVAEHGLSPRVLHAPETTVRDGARLAGRLLGHLPDAIVAVNDALAIGALHRLRSEARRPAVVGFDDIAWARLAEPPLTTVAVDAEAMGALAASLLIDRITGSTNGKPRLIRVPTALRLRASCGCQSASGDVL